MNHSFSIITITKNSGKDFVVTHDSITSLLCRDFEWIIVDGSDDPLSLLIVDSCTNGRATLIRGEDRGISHAFNLGIFAASGQFILILNAGDTYTPGFLDICLKYASPLYILCGSAVLVDDLNDAVGIFKARPESLWRGMHIPHNWMCVPIHIYQEMGGYMEISDAMDYEWCKRAIASYGKNIFRRIPGDQTYGTYLLGGHSDKRYVDGLAATKRINIEYGMNPLLAMLIYIAYYLKQKVATFKFFTYA